MLNPLSLLGGKVKLALGLGLLLAVAAAVAYHFYTVNHLNKELAVARVDLVTSQQNEAKLEKSLEASQASIANLEHQRKIDQVKLNRLTAEMNTSRRQVTDLRKKLERHDIGYLGLNKPGLVENIINRGTEAVGKKFEEISAPEEASDVQ